MYMPQTECYLCKHELEIDDILQKVYMVREVPDGLQKFAGSDTYMEFAFTHLTCPMENFIPCDNSSDAICMPIGGGSKAAMDYVQEHYESKE